MLMPNKVVVNIFLGKGLGGIERSFIDYVSYFYQLGYRSKAIVSKGSKVANLLPDYIDITDFSSAVEWDLFASFRLRKILKQLDADIVIIHGRRAAKLCRFVTNIPKVAVAHNYSLKYLLSLDYIFAITQDLKAKLCSMGYNQDKIFNIPHMIEVPKMPSKQEIYKPVTIGGMGRFVPEKGFDLLLEAIKILKDKQYKFKLLLAGDGPEKAKLQHMVTKLSLDDQVVFLGWVDSIESFYKKINIFCLPSRKESFGLALIEAFSYGKAVVSTKTNGPLQIGVDNIDILFAECESPKDIAKQLELLLKDHKLIKSLGKKAHKKAFDSYNKETNIDKFLSALSRIL